MSKKLTIQTIETLIGKKGDNGSVITHILILDGAYKILFNHKRKGGNMMIYRNQHAGLIEAEFNYGKHKDKAQFKPSHLQTTFDVFVTLDGFIDLFENYYDSNNTKLS